MFGVHTVSLIRYGNSPDLHLVINQGGLFSKKSLLDNVDWGRTFLDRNSPRVFEDAKSVSGMGQIRYTFRGDDEISNGDKAVVGSPSNDELGAPVISGVGHKDDSVISAQRCN